MPEFSWRPATDAASELAAATVEYGRQVGARVLEGHPTEPPPGKTVIWDEASVGLLEVSLDAGYWVEAAPSLRRRVVRRRLGAVVPMVGRTHPGRVVSHESGSGRPLRAPDTSKAGQRSRTAECSSS